MRALACLQVACSTRNLNTRFPHLRVVLSIHHSIMQSSRSPPLVLSAPRPVDRLPEAVLLEMLTFLPARDLLSCGAVDTLFHRLARNAVAWQSAWASRASHGEWAVRPGRVIEDAALSGGAPLWQLSALQPLRWPSSLRRAHFRAVSLEVPRADDAAGWAVGGRGRHGAARTVRVVSRVLPGSDRAIVSNAAFPCANWRRGVGAAAATACAMDDVTSLPFTWAPPVASGVGGGQRGGAPTFSAGAYIVAYFEVSLLAAVADAVDDVSRGRGRCGSGGGGGGGGGGGERILRGGGGLGGGLGGLPGQHPSPHMPVVCVGIAAPGFPVGERMPGWDTHSFGWHSDDGRRYHDSPIGSDYGGGFGVGDVIGCGIVYAPLSPNNSPLPHTAREWAALNATAAGAAWPAPVPGAPPGTVFFTRNGAMQGPAFTSLDTERAWHPTIGLDAPWPIRFNFGAVAAEPFVFDVRAFNAALLQRAVLPLRARLPPMPTRAFLLHAISHVLPLSRTTLAPPPPTLRASPAQSPDPSPKAQRPGPHTLSPPPVTAASASVTITPPPSGAAPHHPRRRLPIFFSTGRGPLLRSRRA